MPDDLHRWVSVAEEPGQRTLCWLDSLSPSSAPGLLTRPPALWPLLPSPASCQPPLHHLGREGSAASYPARSSRLLATPLHPFLPPFPPRPVNLVAAPLVPRTLQHLFTLGLELPFPPRCSLNSPLFSVSPRSSQASRLNLT